MRLFLISLLTLLPLLTHAHMAMEDPPALRYKTNPYKLTQDYDYVSPLLADGSNYPCKGHHKDMGTSAGTPVRTYAAGGTYTMKLAGSATHMGGSCQLSLSYDKGKSFEVFKSFVGGCVRPDPAGDQSFKFKIPEGTPGGKEVLFAWSWFNNQGNREMYMNCAVVTITGGGGLNKPTGPVTGPGEGIGRRSPISSLANKIFSRSPNPTPELHLHKRASGVPIFKANIGNGCLVPAGKDLMFPNPGSQVETAPGANIASPWGGRG
ncbi:extracellular protein [Peziza echinospora]|nr:extracellular protein [Peziza echinospora]